MDTELTLTRDLVLVGGGHTHALVLRMWAMNPLPGARLTVINPAPSAPYSGMLPGFVAGHYGTDALYIDLLRLARAAGARIILGKAARIDPQAREVHVPGRAPIGYDVCSVDVGITSGMPEIAGFTEYAVPAKPLDDFALRWDDFCQDTGPARVAVIGAGVAGAEVAMAAAHRLAQQGRAAQVSLIDRSEALSRLGQRAGARVRAALEQLGVTLFEHAAIAEVTADAVVLQDGQSVLSDLTLGAAGTRPYAWLAECGLPTTQGYLSVGPSLQSTGNPDVFAVGDCAHMEHAPRPKAGVFAVRQAPVLAHNLRAALTGGAMKSYHPQRDYLKLISLGGKEALAEKLGLTLSGAAMWRWKDRIDQKFMRQFAQLAPMRPSTPKEQASGASGAPMLCAGCGSKVGRGVLAGVIGEAAPRRADVTALPGDDAALLRFGDQTQVISTDHLRGFCEDPALMTRIAAIHALGDVWSMGAAPQAALISVILPRMALPLQERTLAEIMHAAREVMGDAGAQIVGGHTTMGAEFTIGFTITGLPSGAPVTLGGAQPGDALVLTKPIGTGVLLAAEMQMRARGSDVAQAYASMSAPLAADAQALRGAHAMTDVTGFGLAGHLGNICRASSVGAQLNARAVPLLPGALELTEAGIRSSLYDDNLSDALALMKAPETARGRLMLDPQTAGGLLAAVPPDQMQHVSRALGPRAVQIGQIIAGPVRLELSE